MKLLGRLIVYFGIFFIIFSVSYVLALRVVPVTFTPLKVVRFVENFFDEGRLAIYSSWCSIGNINRAMPIAVIAAEDNNFLNHNGFDLEAIKKAIEYNKRHKNKKRGASTISQQTAKNVFCYPSRNWLRKGFESYFTLLIEPIWGKRRILEVYLNIVETHENVYGVDATAQKFFKKEAAKINAYEASLITAVFPHPLRSNLAAPSGYVRNRSAKIRGLMRALGPIEY